MKHVVAWVLMICLAPFLTGCADLADKSLTGRLWSSDLASNHNAPNESPNLRISQSADHKDFLVQYDEQRDKDAKIDHRAYWLYANQQRIVQGKKPHFVDPGKAEHLESVPVETNSVSDLLMTSSPKTGAVLLSDGRHFTLAADGRGLGTFQMPTYHDPADRAKLVALTPMAAAGDAAIGVGVVVVIVGPIVWQGLAFSGTTIR